MNDVPSDHSYEKLGAFYLGRTLDPQTAEPGSDLLLYDSKDLTTHAVCVGMTGSGKTGLCMALLEEAAIDGIPAIAIDPKGDLGNLLLTFPSLEPSDFAPWVDPAEAMRKGMDVEQYAASTANKWREGLASWGQGPERIQRLRDSAEFTIYTPGSRAGVPLNILGSFSAPPPEVRSDEDLMRERVSASVSGLLALVGINADPIQSREHILLSNLLDRAWREGRNLGLADLIRQIQQPPFDRIGVLDLESIFPAKERFQLAIGLNNLLGSPNFAAWMEGEPLDVGRLLYTEQGRPRISILSIAHLSDAERMFFVTLLLNEVVAWMRTQPGTSSLRALLYMDEIYGYFPPVQNPPAKTPMLTLLKQARAFGLGVVLATQNPVDLDYKGLSNAGTWFLGRLQTERDRERILDGLQGAGGDGFDRAEFSEMIAGLKSRVFLMKNVHESEPVLFETRWVLSYLRGPLTRQQIQQLMDARKAVAAGAPGRTSAAASTGSAVAAGAGTGSGAQTAAGATAAAGSSAAGESIDHGRATAESPILPSGTPVFFLPGTAASGEGGWIYRPFVLARARVHYVRAKDGIDHWEEVRFAAPLEEDAVEPWDEARQLSIPIEELEGSGDSTARYMAPMARAQRDKSYLAWAKSLSTHLYRTRSLETFQSTKPSTTSRPGEPEGEFRARLAQVSREARDLEIEKLRQEFGDKLERLRSKIASAEEKRSREEEQYKQQKFQTAVSMGATVLSAFFGRKKLSATNVGRATTAARGVGRAARERGDIARAEEKLETLQEQYAALEEELTGLVGAMEVPVPPEQLEIEAAPVRLRKSDTIVDPIGVLWAPWRSARGGLTEPAFPPGLLE